MVGGGNMGAALLGGALSYRGILAWIRGIVGAATGCLVAASFDALAVLGVGAILAIADFMRAVG